MSEPAVPMTDSRPAGRRDNVRKELGIPADSVVVLALPPITAANDPMLGAWAYKLFNKTGRTTRFLLPQLGDEYYPMVRFFEDTRHLANLVTPPSDTPLETVFDVADVGIAFPAETAEGEFIRRAHQAGLPLLLSPAAADAGGVRGRPGVSLSTTLTAKAIAADLLRLFG